MHKLSAGQTIGSYKSSHDINPHWPTLGDDCCGRIGSTTLLPQQPIFLVVQDYSSKWAEAFPIPDQTASRITEELVKLCSLFGLPDILHSDQGRKFESTVLQKTLEAFGIMKTRTSAYHPQCDGMVERLNRSLLQLLRTYYVDKESSPFDHGGLTLYAHVWQTTQAPCLPLLSCF